MDYFGGCRGNSEGRSTLGQCPSRVASSSPFHKLATLHLPNRRRCLQATTAPVLHPSCSRQSHLVEVSMAEHSHKFPWSATETCVSEEQRRFHPLAVPTQSLMTLYFFYFSPCVLCCLEMDICFACMQWSSYGNENVVGLLELRNYDGLFHQKLKIINWMICDTNHTIEAIDI